MLFLRDAFPRGSPARPSGESSRCPRPAAARSPWASDTSAHRRRRGHTARCWPAVRPGWPSSSFLRAGRALRCRAGAHRGPLPPRGSECNRGRRSAAPGRPASVAIRWVVACAASSLAVDLPSVCALSLAESFAGAFAGGDGAASSAGAACGASAAGSAPGVWAQAVGAAQRTRSPHAATIERIGPIPKSGNLAYLQYTHGGWSCRRAQ